MPSKSTPPPTRPASIPPQLHDLQTAAQRLACSTRHLQREIDRGNVRAVRLGRAVRISEKELRRICDGQQPS
jgi:excisionase family DNA binding protein